MMTKKDIINILVKRDNCTVEEAEDLLRSCANEISEMIEAGDFELAEEILMYDLGLELDYLPIVLGMF